MGGLINTKGTRLLAGHFNNEFSSYIDWYRVLQNSFDAAPAITPPYTLFDAAGWPGGQVNLLDLTLSVTDIDPRHSRRSTHETLLPDIKGHSLHKNLEGRWKWFLTLPATSPYQLSAANHNLIAQYILTALRDLSYNSISFDVHENPPAQTVTPSDLPDSVNGTAVKIMQILLQVTGPIPQGAVLPLGLPPLDGPPY